MKHPITGAILVASLVLAASIPLGCGDDADSDNNTSTTDTKQVALQFEGVVGDEAFSCDSTYELGLAQTEVSFTEFKLFVSNVVFTDAAGDQVTMELDSDTPFSEGTTTLLDFEDATGTCANGTPQTNTEVAGTIPADFEPVGVSFEVGVPFESNHQDQATAPDPLSLTQMFWNWQGGYKFVRIDGTAGDNAGIRLHLGSTGCMLAEGSTTDVETCMNPNRVTVVRDNIDLAETVFSVDAGELLEDLDLTPDAEGNSVNCQSMGSQTDCEAVFPKLGLPFGDDAAGGQTFITVR